MVSATADPIPAPPSASKANPAVQRWIFGSWQDLLLFILTPLVVVPVMDLVNRRLSLDEISAFVAAFGATGHHLPGMIRAYGDRALFARFRVRFIAAPIFFVGVCLLLRLNDLSAMTTILTFWGLWHGAAQVYGFERIYDAKAEIRSDLGARLDLAVTVSWFLLAALVSPGRMTDILADFYLAGGPLIPASAYQAFVGFWTALTIGISIAFALHFAFGWWRGERRSLIKLVLILSSIGFWWYAMVGIEHVLLGVALFEVFHDIQYLSIVWYYNRRRVEQTGDLSRAVKFLFRPKTALIFVYVGLVFSYGYASRASIYVDSSLLRDLLLSLVAASALLHFYYDGFIWKVRDLETRAGLGLSQAGAKVAGPRAIPAWLQHGAKWTLFVVPIALLAVGQLDGRESKTRRLENIASIFPEFPQVHFNLGAQAESEGHVSAALAHFERALDLAPDYAEAHTNLGALLQGLGNDELALEHYAAALEIEPSLGKALNNLAWLRAASARDELRDPEAAMHWAEMALSVSGRREPERLDTLAVAYASAGRFERAIATAEEAVRRAENQGMRSLAHDIRARLAGFRNGAAYVDR